MILEIISLAVGVAGFAFGARCYWELWKWARQCQGARIAIAFKRKVRMQAPLVEWLMWCNQLDKDKDSQGRVVFSQAGVSVAITRAVRSPGKVRSAIRRAKPVQRGASAPAVREGSWDATDETKVVA